MADDDFQARLDAIDKEIEALYDGINDKYAFFLSRVFTMAKEPDTLPGRSIYTLVGFYGPGSYDEKDYSFLPTMDGSKYTQISIQITGPKAIEFEKLANMIEKIYDKNNKNIGIRRTLYGDSLKYIEPLPHVKESLIMMTEAYDAKNKAEYQAAYDLFKEACIDSYLVHVGLSSQQGIKSANKQ